MWIDKLIYTIIALSGLLAIFFIMILTAPPVVK
jgi:hypothetical protein